MSYNLQFSCQCQTLSVYSVSQDKEKMSYKYMSLEAFLKNCNKKTICEMWRYNTDVRYYARRYELIRNIYM